MSPRQLNNYLRMYRKRIGLTQKELAFLLGFNHPAKISRYERSSQNPRLITVIAYEVVFQTVSRNLFGGLFERVETETRQRIRQLLEMKLECAITKRNQQKISHLEQLIQLKNVVPKSVKKTNHSLH